MNDIPLAVANCAVTTGVKSVIKSRFIGFRAEPEAQETLLALSNVIGEPGNMSAAIRWLVGRVQQLENDDLHSELIAENVQLHANLAAVPVDTMRIVNGLLGAIPNIEWRPTHDSEWHSISGLRTEISNWLADLDAQVNHE